MIFSQANKELGNKRFLFIKYRDMQSDGKSKDSDSWMGIMERTKHKYLSFYLELIK